ncbi:HK97 gp10 family phage protein, partial [Candidatus Woesearchaeota archaeon]
ELTSLGENIVDEARSIVPVRTGYLRSTIYYERKGKHKLIVGAKAHYAGYVEYGTRKMAAQPYLRPAIARCIPNFFKRLFRRLR